VMGQGCRAARRATMLAAAKRLVGKAIVAPVSGLAAA
jgi:hypothetical protein